MRTGKMGLASPVRATLHQRRDLPRAPQFTMARACIWQVARNEFPLASWRSVMFSARLKRSRQNRGIQKFIATGHTCSADAEIG
jgi:hypothetical protein